MNGFELEMSKEMISLEVANLKLAKDVNAVRIKNRKLGFLLGVVCILSAYEMKALSRRIDELENCKNVANLKKF